MKMQKAIVLPSENAEILSMSDINNASCGGAERHPLADNIYFLEEEGRKGEYCR